MPEIGQGALVLSLVASLYAAFAFFFSERQGREELRQRGNGALWAGAAGVTIASGQLFYLLLSHDFQVRYVYEHTSTYLPTLYLISAFWAGQEGSLLLWLWFLSLLTLIVAARRDELRAYASAALAFVQSFLAFLLVAASEPFATLPLRPVEGLGLNPLLENFWMIVHPPVIFLGYAAYAVAFAFALAALAKGHFDGGWLRQVRFWNILAWLLLGVGILTGAWWAYLELGWGGYWGWDPVENSSLLPWLTGTAFLHSALAQERRGIFKRWNFVLLTFTFVLCFFATFVTRSGIIQSVHAFGQSPSGPFLITFMLLILAGSLSLLYRQRGNFSQESESRSLLSRESAFLAGNFLLCGAAGVIFLGTVYPILTELVSGVAVELGAPFYRQAGGPVALGVLALLGLCPLLRWGSSEKIGRGILPALGFALLVSLALVALGVQKIYVLLSWALCAFAGGSISLRIAQELCHTYPKSIWKARQRYGSYLVHLSMVMIAIGVIGESSLKIEKNFSLAPGEKIEFLGYRLEYESFTFKERNWPDRERYATVLKVYQGGKVVARLTPEKNFHWNIRGWVTEVALYRTLKEDLYLVLGWLEEDGLATFQIMVNPLIIWLWIGGAAFIAGGALVLPSAER